MSDCSILNTSVFICQRMIPRGKTIVTWLKRTWLTTVIILLFVVICRHNKDHVVFRNSANQTDLWCVENVTRSKHCLPLTALVSFPGSGNTWLRYLIEKMTGIPTGSVYYDDALRKGGFSGEGKFKCNYVVIKTHEFNNKFKAIRYSKAILLIRNPFESLLSEFNRRNTRNNHTQRASLDVFIEKWHLFFSRHASIWSKFIMSWTRFPGRSLIVFYDNLKTTLFTELANIADFLDDDGEVKGRIVCAVRDPEGPFHRSPSPLRTRDFYNQKQVQFINSEIDKVHFHFRFMAFNMSKWKL